MNVKVWKCKTGYVRFNRKIPKIVEFSHARKPGNWVCIFSNLGDLAHSKWHLYSCNFHFIFQLRCLDQAEHTVRSSFFPGRGKVALQTGLIVSTKASTNLGSIHMCFLIPQSLVSLLKLINFCFYFFIFLPFFLFLSIFLAFFPKLNKVYFKNILT